MKVIKAGIYPNCVFVIILSSITLLSLFIAGCKEKKTFSDLDPNMVPLERWEKINGELLSPEVKERLQVVHEVSLTGLQNRRNLVVELYYANCERIAVILKLNLLTVFIYK